MIFEPIVYVTYLTELFFTNYCNTVGIYMRSSLIWNYEFYDDDILGEIVNMG